MADFSRPEYASYVQLCRELRLEREFRPGDWFLTLVVAAGWGQGGGYVPTDRPFPEMCTESTRLERADKDHVWLPSLADWLEMLYSADWWRRYELGPLAGGDYRISADGPPVIVGPSGNYSDLAYPRRSGTGRTYEEAAARLYVAVTRSPAGPAPPSTAR